MNAFRIIGIALISMLLLVSLVSMGTTETLQKSTKYENIKYRFTKISESFLKESVNLDSIIEESLPLMQAYCENTNKSSYEFQQNGYNFNLTCDTINQGTDTIVDSVMNDLVGTFIEETYYKEYNCEFLECIQQQQPMVLVSEKAHEYWTKQSKMFLFISLGLAVILFLLTKHKSNFFIISGGLIIGTSIIVSQLPAIASQIASTAMSSAVPTLQQLGVSSDIFEKIASSFFSQAGNIYLWFLLMGIGLVAIGILFKVFNLAEKIAKLFRRKNKSNKKSEKEPVKKSEKEKQKNKSK